MPNFCPRPYYNTHIGILSTDKIQNLELFLRECFTMGEITNRILEMLENQEMSQKEFCEKTGVAQSTFTNWKQRETDPPANLIPAISYVLKVSFAYLLTGKEVQGADINRKFAEIRRRYEPISKHYDRCSEEGKKEVVMFAEYAANRWSLEDSIRKAKEYAENYEKQAPSTQSELAK
jgi:transcriptional regulator with XRE-family HTH domain